jgi:hypothetical protein
VDVSIGMRMHDGCDGNIRIIHVVLPDIGGQGGSALDE